MITCPVCGYAELEAPLKGEICPSCGTQFGLTDRGRNHQAIRALWIESGACWNSDVIRKPPFWSPVEQLRNVGYFVTDKEKRSITPNEAAISVRMEFKSEHQIFEPNAQSKFPIANSIRRFRKIIGDSAPPQQIAYS